MAKNNPYALYGKPVGPPDISDLKEAVRRAPKHKGVLTFARRRGKHQGEPVELERQWWVAASSPGQLDPSWEENLRQRLTRAGRPKAGWEDAVRDQGFTLVVTRWMPRSKDSYGPWVGAGSPPCLPADARKAVSRAASDESVLYLCTPDARAYVSLSREVVLARASAANSLVKNWGKLFDSGIIPTRSYGNPDTWLSSFCIWLGGRGMGRKEMSGLLASGDPEKVLKEQWAAFRDTDPGGRYDCRAPDMSFYEALLGRKSTLILPAKKTGRKTAKSPKRAAKSSPTRR